MHSHIRHYQLDCAFILEYPPLQPYCKVILPDMLSNSMSRDVEKLEDVQMINK